MRDAAGLRQAPCLSRHRAPKRGGQEAPCAAVACRHRPPPAPTVRSSWPMGVQRPVLGVGAMHRAPCPPHLRARPAGHFRGAVWCQDRQGLACPSPAEPPTGLLKAWSAVLTGATRIPFRVGIPIKNWMPGNPNYWYN